MITILNIYGVKVVAVVNNTGVFFEILGMVVFAVFLAIVHNNQGLGVIFDADKSGNIFAFPAPLTASFFLVGMFMSLYVIYGFDTASTLAEETRNPRVGAPKAVIASVIGSFVIGAIFLWGVLIAVPDMGEAVASFATGPQQVIEGVMSTFGATLYLFVVVAAIFVCCMSILTSTIRLAFGMARDNQLPFSKTMSRVSPTLHTPVWTCVIVGGLAAIPFIQFAGAAVIAVGATASIYLSYLLGNLAFMRARAKGWPKTKAPFSLGGWGKVVNVVAILWGAAMLLNFLTPSAGELRVGPERRGRLVHADHLEPEADPDRLLRRRGPAGRLQDRLPEQDPGDLDRVLADRDRRRDLLLRGPEEEAVRTGEASGGGRPLGDRPGRSVTDGRGRRDGGPARRAIIRSMKLVVSERAAAYIAERGGSAWVWLDPHRGLVGSHIYLEAHAEPPRASRRTSFTRSSSQRRTGSRR